MATTATEAGARPRLRVRHAVLSMDFLVLGLNYADRAAISVAAPFIMKEFGFTNTEFGVILSIFFFGYAPFNWIGGHLSDKLGPRSVMGVAVAWWSVFTAATAAGFNFVSFLIIRLLFGFGEGPQATVTAKTMSNWFPQQELGRSLGIANSSTPLGGAVAAPLVVGILEATSGNWRIAFIVLGLVGLLFSLGWFVVVRDRPEVHPWVSKDERDEIIPHRVGGGLDSAHLALPLRRYLREPLVISTAFAFFGYSWVLYTFLSWFPKYLLTAQHVNLANLAWAGAIPWIAGFLGLVAGGVFTDWLAKRTGNPPGSRKSIIIVSLLITGLLMVLCMTASNVGTAVTMMSAIVFFMYVTAAQYFAIIADLVPGSRYGSVVGYVHFLANCAGIAAPIIVGIILDQTHSWGLTFGLAAVICAAGGLCMLAFGNIRRMRNLATEALATVEPAAEKH
jgi:ACS family hexuronate transporter-like MFS transporter